MEDFWREITGASRATANQHGPLYSGVAASEKLAETDLGRRRRDFPAAERVGARHSFDPDPIARIMSDGHHRGAKILKGYIREMEEKYPNWSKEEQQRAALAAYNQGPGNVRRAVDEGRDVDHYTTGQDYSNDVLARAQYYRRQEI
ncbi:lysozyme g-like [Neosynchiropus ocellatus]